MKIRMTGMLSISAFFFSLSIALIFTNRVCAEEVLRTKQDTNREVIQTYAQVYLEQKDYARSEALLAAYLLKDSDDGALWVLLGQSQIESRQYSQACFAFKKANEVFRKKSDQNYALYLFADCLSRGGSFEAAVQILKQLSKESGGDDSATLALDQIQAKTLKAGQALPPYTEKSRGQLRVSGGMGAGFDSNVLLVNENVVSNTPIANRGSFFLNPALQVGYLGKLWGQNFDSRYLASFTDYTNEVAKSYNSLYQRADFIYGSGPQRWGVFADALFMNRSPFQLYNATGGISWLNSRKLSKSETLDFEVPIRYQNYRIDNTGLPINVRTGFGGQFRMRYRSMQSDRSMFLAQAAVDTQVTSGTNYDETQLLLPVFWSFELPYLRNFGILNTLMGEVDGQWYWRSDVNRKEMSARIGTGMNRQFDRIKVSLDYTYFKNVSTVSAARYQKETVLLMLSYDLI